MNIMPGQHYTSEKVEQNPKYVQTDEAVLHLGCFTRLDMKMSTGANVSKYLMMSVVCPYCQHSLRMTGLDAMNWHNILNQSTLEASV